MKDDRRKTVKEIAEAIDDLIEKVVDAGSDAQECLDNIPEGLEASEQAEKAEEEVNWWDELNDTLREAQEKLEEFE